jgi:hypothetical protein
MKQKMQAELLCLDANDMAPTIRALKKLGFKIEVLDWVDEYEGELLSPALWLLARIESELDPHAFFRWVHDIVMELDSTADLVEAGLSDSQTLVVS